MDVFLRNVPPHLTDQRLRENLDPYIKDIGVEHWTCQKPRKKDFGTVTFLHERDGQMFLQIYGARGSHRLSILNSRVLCQKSKEPLDTFRLASLKKEAEEQSEAAHHTKEAEDGQCVLNFDHISYGYLDYVGRDLSYYSHADWHPRVSEASAKFAKRQLVITFPNSAGKFRIEMPYRIVESILVSPGTITLTLWEPPRSFLMPDASLYPQESTVARRLTGLLLDGDSYADPVMPYIRRTAYADPVMSLIYRISTPQKDFETTMQRLIKRDFLPINRGSIPRGPPERKLNLKQGWLNLKAKIQEIVKVRGYLVPFGILYQAEALVRNGFLLPWTVEALLEKIFQSYKDESGERDYNISPDAVRKLFSQIPFPSREIDPSTFSPDALFQLLGANEAEIRGNLGKPFRTQSKGRNLVPVYRATVTPTSITLHGPDYEAKNRILRRFPDHTDYFLRVQFCDEDGSDMFPSNDISYELVYNRFRIVFQKGIEIASRIYNFLGFSHSSLRGHSAWFMATFYESDRLQSYFTVISNLGKFDNIYSPARCAARIGQAFSETPMALSLAEHDIQHMEIPDIHSQDGSRVFSDGVGTISPGVIEAMQSSIIGSQKAPTCFQIRWGAAKGMLALDPCLKGRLMCVRPSMIKFESSDIADLEICDMASTPTPLFLNQQTIKILEDMGVSHEWFLEHQHRAIMSLQHVTESIANTAKFMARQDIGHGLGFPRFLTSLFALGINYRDDGFLASVVEATILRELRLLKHKARIPIHQGVKLFGILDETGYLQEGEIYIAFDEATFIRGCSTNLDNMRMIVTRSPALHPGDIQLAVNMVPPNHHPLRQLRNCVVFSQHGERDLPSCLSGGDLDGDEFEVIWDSSAVDQCQSIFAPADYPRVKPLDIGRTVTRDDMTEFFIKFMETDQLGRIATKHKILADQRDAGTWDPDCLKLAEMHSAGVDYSKTGIPVDIGEFRKIKMSLYRPDFLAPAPPTVIHDRSEISFDDKANDPPGGNRDEDDNAGPVYKYYRSDKILGKLFRAIDEKKIWAENVKVARSDTIDIWTRLLTVVKRQFKPILESIFPPTSYNEARKLRTAYEDAIWNLTLEYSDYATMTITELEVFTGTVFNRSGIQTRRQRDKSVRLKDDFNNVAQWAESMIRRLQDTAAEDGSQRERTVEEIKRALSSSITCLKVGCEEERWAQAQWGRTEAKFQSFKVIAACCVVKEMGALERLPAKSLQIRRRG
ncbi:RNA dependent RNA polymerase-domain-containing protein [Stachybotrys elegans]|uniref:RNA-dependent RNA polymerase n=1 Tax=Stachybotrys elegans TaxID=80388 RepID=A0A8K0WNS7_9HYPO|nr:RNA dependent RNA polymerase-domain-containing protein [Stachybotrys elegans]